jgi:hypothetical protein
MVIDSVFIYTFRYDKGNGTMLYKCLATPTPSNKKVNYASFKLNSFEANDLVHEGPAIPSPDAGIKVLFIGTSDLYIFQCV